MNRPVSRVVLIPALAAACVLCLAAGAAGNAGDRSAGATARAWAIKVIVPGQPGAASRVLAAPDDAVAFDGAFAYPADGSIVSGELRHDERLRDERRPGQRRRDVAGDVALALQGRDRRADRHRRDARERRQRRARPATPASPGFAGLVVLGQPVTPTANQTIPLADWGYAIALEQKSQRIDKPTPGHHDFVTALDITLTADHGGLPAQSEIQVGYAEANAQASEAAPIPTPPSVPTTTVKTPREPRNDGLPAGAVAPARRDAEAERPGLRLPGLRLVVVRRHVRRDARRRLRRLASRRRHLRAARRAAARDRARHRVLGRLEPHRRAGGSGCATTTAGCTTTRISRRTRRSR